MDRRRELAVRAALGARQYEITRPFVMEAAYRWLRGIVGGSFSPCGRRQWSVDWHWRSSEVWRAATCAVTWRVIAVIALAASGCAAVCGVVTALLVSRRNVVDDLRRGATAPPHELLVRRMLVTGEVALAFVLMVCVTLLGGSLYQVLSVNPGFNAQGVLAAQVSVPLQRVLRDRRPGRVILRGAPECPGEPPGIASRPSPTRFPCPGTRAGRPWPCGRMRSLPKWWCARLARRTLRRDANTGCRRSTVRRWRPCCRRTARPGERIVGAPAVFFHSRPRSGRQPGCQAMPSLPEIVGVVGDVANRALDEPCSRRCICRRCSHPRDPASSSCEARCLTRP